MEVIARKNGSYAFYTFLCFFFGIASMIGVIAIAITMPESLLEFGYFLIMAVVLIPAGFWCLNKAKLPKELIFLDGGTITLYNGHTFTLEMIRDITYKRASSRYGHYSYGDIIFDLRNGETIKVHPVADVEEVGKNLSRLIYGQRQ